MKWKILFIMYIILLPITTGQITKKYQESTNDIGLKHCSEKS